MVPKEETKTIISDLYEYYEVDLEEAAADFTYLQDDIDGISDDKLLFRLPNGDGYSGLDLVNDVSGSLAIEMLFGSKRFTNPLAEKDPTPYDEEVVEKLLFLVLGRRLKRYESTTVYKAVRLCNYAVDESTREGERLKDLIEERISADAWHSEFLLPLHLTLFLRNAPDEEQEQFWEDVRPEMDETMEVAAIIKEYTDELADDKKWRLFTEENGIDKKPMYREILRLSRDVKAMLDKKYPDVHYVIEEQILKYVLENYKHLFDPSFVFHWSEEDYSQYLPTGHKFWSKEYRRAVLSFFDDVSYEVYCCDEVFLPLEEGIISRYKACGYIYDEDFSTAYRFYDGDTGVAYTFSTIEEAEKWLEANEDEDEE